MTTPSAVSSSPSASPAEGAAPLPAPYERVIGRYALCRPFARGGMATVHLARQVSDEGFSRVVAVKRLHAHVAESPESLGMFLDEARLASRIRHSNVVPTLDVVSREGELLIVMEYVLGESLSSLVRASSEQHIPIDIALRITIDALHGLHAAHLATDEGGAPLGIVHRDVSPQNILIGVDGVSRIVDFGIAKAAGRLQTTQNNKLKGKIAYMAPEQLERKDELDARVDVYATSIVLWELLAGRRLFRGEDEVHTFKKALHDVVLSPRTHNLDVPPELAQLVLEGLSRDRNRRPASAREMAHRLEELGLAARATDLADWVNQTSHASLSEARQRLKELESAPDPAVLLERALPSATSWSETTVRSMIENSLVQSEAATDMMESPGEGTHTATITTGSIHGPRRRGVLWSAGALAALLGGLIWWLFPFQNDAPALLAPQIASEQPDQPLSQAAANEKSPPGPVQEEPTSQTPRETEPETDSPAVGLDELPTEKDAPQTISPPRKAPAKVQRPVARPASTKKSPRSDCDNPFTIDKDGVRVPKLHCL